MRNPIFFSTGVFVERAIEDVIATAAREGIFNLELSATVRCPERPDDVLSSLPGHFRYLIHNYFPPEASGLVLNLASGNKEILKRTKEFCTRAIALAAAVGSEWHSVHSGFCTDPDFRGLGRSQTHLARIGREAALETFYDSLADLLAVAKRHEVGLCIENNVISADNLVNGKNELYLMTHPRDFERFGERRELAEVGLLIDMGHAKVSANAEAFDLDWFVDVTRDRTAMVHLSDNDGDHDQNASFSEDAWFGKVLKTYPASIPMIIEVYRLSPSGRQTCLRAVEAMLRPGDGK